jgi:hypothetical protein
VAFGLGSSRVIFTLVYVIVRSMLGLLVALFRRDLSIRALFIAARQARLTIQVSTAGSINEALLRVSGLDQVATVVTLD